MSLTLEVTQTVLRAVAETTPLDVVIDQRPVTVEITSGTPLSADIAAALNAAHAPSATNPFVTLADASAGYPLEVPVTRDWSVALNAYLDVLDAVGVHLSPALNRSITLALFHDPDNPLGEADHALLVVAHTVLGTTVSYLQAFGSTSGLHTAYLAAVLGLVPLTAADLAAHVSADDPHGDRLYAEMALEAHASNHTAHGPLTDGDIPASITRDTELSASMLAEVNARTAAIAGALQGHISDVDPHGDRAYVDAQRYSRLFMLGA